MIILIESTMMKLHLNVHLAFLHFGLLEKERKIRVKKIGRAEAILVYFDMSHMRNLSEGTALLKWRVRVYEWTFKKGSHIAQDRPRHRAGESLVLLCTREGSEGERL